MDNVEVPKQWSQIATDIIAQKYFRKAGVPQPDGSLGKETSAKQGAHRMANCWKVLGDRYHYFASKKDAEIFYDETVYSILNQACVPNSPQWFNTGLHESYNIVGKPQGHYYVNPVDAQLKKSQNAYERPQPHACFILSVSDDLVNDGGIMDLWTREARIFKYGSGVGTNFSAIRGEGEKLSGGGTSSGLMSFLKIGDRAAGAIKSGGTTRRAAKMVCLDLDHPDVVEFIRWKVVEEQKVAALVAGSRLGKRRLQAVMAARRPDKLDPARIDADPKRNAALRAALREARAAMVPEGYIQRAVQLAAQGITELVFPEYDTDWDSDAYLTVAGQNSNNSIRVPNGFFDVLERGGDWELRRRTDRKVSKRLPAEDLWNEIAYAAWACADPGVQYDTTINEWHTCPEDGRINASNPCSEYMFLDDTACNLASLNLAPFFTPEGEFELEHFRHAVRIWTVVLEISVLMASFPSRSIAEKSY